MPDANGKCATMASPVAPARRALRWLRPALDGARWLRPWPASDDVTMSSSWPLAPRRSYLKHSLQHECRALRYQAGDINNTLHSKNASAHATLYAARMLLRSTSRLVIFTTFSTQHECCRATGITYNTLDTTSMLAHCAINQKHSCYHKYGAATLTGLVYTTIGITSIEPHCLWVMSHYAASPALAASDRAALPDWSYSQPSLCYAACRC